MKNSKLILSAAALASLSPATASAENPAVLANHDIVQSQISQFPCTEKVLGNCPKNPEIPKVIEAVEKAFLPKNPGFEKNPDFEKNPSTTQEAIACIHLLEAQIDEFGIRPVATEDVAQAEACLELFAEKLLD